MFNPQSFNSFFGGNHLSAGTPHGAFAHGVPSHSMMPHGIPPASMMPHTVPQDNRQVTIPDMRKISGEWDSAHHTSEMLDKNMSKHCIKTRLPRISTKIVK